jgi:hypothetical protein
MATKLRLQTNVPLLLALENHTEKLDARTASKLRLQTTRQALQGLKGHTERLDAGASTKLRLQTWLTVFHQSREARHLFLNSECTCHFVSSFIILADRDLKGAVTLSQVPFLDISGTGNARREF